MRAPNVAARRMNASSRIQDLNFMTRPPRGMEIARTSSLAGTSLIVVYDSVLARLVPGDAAIDHAVLIAIDFDELSVHTLFRMTPGVHEAIAGEVVHQQLHLAGWTVGRIDPPGQFAALAVRSAHPPAKHTGYNGRQDQHGQHDDGVTRARRRRPVAITPCDRPSTFRHCRRIESPGVLQWSQARRPIRCIGLDTQWA